MYLSALTNSSACWIVDRQLLLVLNFPKQIKTKCLPSTACHHSAHEAVVACADDDFSLTNQARAIISANRIPPFHNLESERNAHQRKSRDRKHLCIPEETRHRNAEDRKNMLLRPERHQERLHTAETGPSVPGACAYKNGGDVSSNKSDRKPTQRGEL